MPAKASPSGPSEPATHRPLGWMRPAEPGRFAALPAAPVAVVGASVVLPTHPLHGAIRRGLLAGDRPHEEAWKSPEGHSWRLRTEPTGLANRHARPLPGADANLLKAHLDLVGEGVRAGGGPGFWYELGPALDRLGYRRHPGGGFHPATVKEHLGRLAQLGALHLSWVGPEAPWASSEPLYRFARAAEAGPLRPLDGAEALVRLGAQARLWVQPGPWWGLCEPQQQRLLAPAQLLALPLDGMGNQVHRIALLLAAELAGAEGAAHLAGQGGRVVSRRLGAVLAAARVADSARLREDAAKRLNTPRRLRGYLAGEGFADEGALAALRALAGFEVDILDEAAFWATGRGWVDRFWGARLRLGVRPQPWSHVAAG